MTDSELVRWAVKEVRLLDEAARSMIPDFESMSSDEVGRLKRLELLADALEIEEDLNNDEG